MNLGEHGHLTYCTNIHPGETWDEIFQSLKDYVLPIKKRVSPTKPFGIGLRLSNKASCELIKDLNLGIFKKWLEINDLYVFTLNGFPYGEFHDHVVKDKVHSPDWTTTDRLAYTLRLAKILAHLLHENLDGGISTSPISYKPWLESEEVSRERVMNLACNHFFILIEELIRIKETTGKTIHIDIEPEPDGLIENADELIEFFKFYLIPDGKEYLKEKLLITSAEAKSAIKEHIRACYDVCHHAVAFEKAGNVLERYKKEGIKVGKIQISAAVKVNLEKSDKSLVYHKLKKFEESTYLHQVIQKNKDGAKKQYPDLTQAFNFFDDNNIAEWRIHFHVPLFINNYGELESTQDDIAETLKIHKKDSITNHLEIETYTWDVLPEELKLDLVQSIEREMNWVIDFLVKK